MVNSCDSQWDRLKRGYMPWGYSNLYLSYQRPSNQFFKGNEGQIIRKFRELFFFRLNGWREGAFYPQSTGILPTGIKARPHDTPPAGATNTNDSLAGIACLCSYVFQNNDLEVNFVTFHMFVPDGWKMSLEKHHHWQAWLYSHGSRYPGRKRAFDKCLSFMPGKAGNDLV